MSRPNNSSNSRSQGRGLLLFVLLLCSLALLTKIQLPRVTYAVAPVQQEQEQRDKLAGVPSVWPVHGVITSGFGWRSAPFGPGNELHAGIDIAVAGGVPVVATADGQVLQSGLAGGYGNLVQIDHRNGISTLYGHNSQLAVSVGQTVKKGQVISYAGSTGQSTGPHVHYEVRENGNAIDPWKYLVFHNNALTAQK
jgi:murein DD-endopeptidase MepM/ murein hydrolase activator NlpD